MYVIEKKTELWWIGFGGNFQLNIVFVNSKYFRSEIYS